MLLFSEVTDFVRNSLMHNFIHCTVYLFFTSLCLHFGTNITAFMLQFDFALEIVSSW